MSSAAQRNDSSPENLDELLDRGFRYALSLTHDRHAAEDLIQDAITTMLTKGADWESSYLFATIRNRFIDGYRRGRVLQFLSLENDARSGIRNDAEHPGPLDSLDLLEAAHLHRALDSLRVEEREALFLAVVEGYTAEEIARHTDRPRGTVLSLIFRAKRKLRQRLATHRGSPRATSAALELADVSFP